MINPELLIKRLSIIKLLYNIALEQSKQSESISFFSILSFHDSVEMFVKLAAEHKEIKAEKFNFIEYWENMPYLTLKENMRTLNARRVNLKHKGLIPAKIEIETSRIYTTDFFEQNTKTVFDIEFSEISLFDLIKFETVKTNLVKAQNDLSQNKLTDSVLNSTTAFEELLKAYKETKQGHRKTTLFEFSPNIKIDSFNRSNGTDERLPKMIKKINEKFNEIEKALEVISFGFDSRKFSKFKMLTPESYLTTNGRYLFKQSDKLNNISKEDCQFLVDFVLECSLKLQDFDYENPNII